MTETLVCAFCRQPFEKEIGQANRQRRVLGGAVRFFCTLRCCGAYRRLHKPKEQRVAEKAAYDRARRVALGDEILAQKRAYHRRTYTPEKGREQRKNRSFDHTAYCRQYYADPTRKQEKIEYDIQRRASAYAEFAEAWRLLIELEREIRTRCPDKYERQKGRGYFIKINERRRHDRQVARIQNARNA